MFRTILTLAAVLAATAATAQEAIHPKDPEAGVPGYKRKFMPPQGSLDWLPDGARIVATIKPPAPPMGKPERIVISYGAGGLIYEHNVKFAGYRNADAEVEIRGPCQSACTLITAYISKDKLCFAPGAFLAFHMAHRNGVQALVATMEMYESYPDEIRDWLDRQGGWKKLTIATFWTLHDRELWAMGYPKCQ